MSRDRYLRQAHQVTVRSAALVISVLAAAGAPQTASAVPLVETFVYTVGGQAPANPPGCTTGGAPAPVFNYFGALPPFVPTAGLGPCNLAGGFRHRTAPAGPLSDATALSVTFGPNTFDGTAAANAISGKIGAKTTGSFTGPSNGLIYEGASAFGKFTEGLTLHDPGIPDGTPGTARLGITVEGALSAAFAGNFITTSDVELRYQIGAGPIFNLFRAQLNNAAPFVATVNGVAFTPGQVLDGFTLGAGTISGKGEIFTFEFPIVWGDPFDFTVGLLGLSSPGTGGTAIVDFFASAQITEIRAFARGLPVADFMVTSASGALYGPDGVRLPGANPSVPEPSTALLWALVAIGFIVCIRRHGESGSTRHRA